VDGIVTGSGNLTLTHPAGAFANFEFFQQNTYTGVTILQSGQLFIHSNKALGSGASGTVVRSALILSTAGGGPINYTEPETLTLDGGHLTNDLGDNTFAGAINLASFTPGGAIRNGGSLFTLAGPLGIGAVPLSIDPGLGGIRINGLVSGTAGLELENPGTLTLTANNTYQGLTTLKASSATLIVNGVQPNGPITVKTGTVGGNGMTGPITLDSNDVLDYLSPRTLSPGDGGPGILTVQGDLTLRLRTTLAVSLNGPTAGAGYDQLKVRGNVNLASSFGASALALTFGYTPAIGDKFTIIDNDGADAIVGAFDGWPEGATKLINGNPFYLTYKGGDGNDLVLTRTTDFIVTGTDAGVPGRVRVFDAASKAQRFSFLPYGPKFKGGVRVASADVNNDGLPDIITVSGPGTPTLVKVFNGAAPPGGTPQLLYQFKPYGNFKGGAFVAAGGDVNGDRLPDIITGPGAGMASLVKIFSGINGASFGGFSAFGAFKGGVTVAAGDVNGDGTLDIIAGMGAGNKPRVRIFDAASRTQIAGPLGSFLAYGANFKGGVFVAAGDVNGDGVADAITGPGAGTAPLVKVFSRDEPAPRVLLAYQAGMKGVRVGAVDVNGDNVAEIVTALGPGGNSQVRLFDNRLTAAIDSFFAESLSFKKGFFIA
jgi:hypothetical protein